MLFSIVAISLSLTASTLAVPTWHYSANMKRANSTSGNVLTAGQSYADFQISDGVAGNALDEVNAKFPIDTSNLAAVSDADHEIIKNAREIAEAAETDSGGFNDAIDEAGEDTDAGVALQNGKIKNKVLKLQLEVLDLKIQQAQGDDSVADKLAEEQTKLDTNIQQDQDAAGQTSQSVDFDDGTD